jgi:hypothetical protein
MSKKDDGKRLVKVVNLNRKGEDIHVQWNNQNSGENVLIQDGATVKLSNTIIEILKNSGKTIYEAQTVNDGEGEQFKSKFVPNYYVIEIEEKEKNNTQTEEQKKQAQLAEALSNAN